MSILVPNEFGFSFVGFFWQQSPSTNARHLWIARSMLRCLPKVCQKKSKRTESGSNEDRT